MRVEFLRDELYENQGRHQGHAFKAGEQYDFTQDFADRWLRRGAVAEVAFSGKTVDVGTSGPFVPVKGKARPSAPPKSVKPAAPDIKAGQAVRLKSGGAVMVAAADAIDGKVTAAWQNADGSEASDDFTIATLDLLTPEDIAAAASAAAPKPLAPPKPGDAG